MVVADDLADAILGQLVPVPTGQTADGRSTVRARDQASVVACPLCGQGAGQRCVTLTGGVFANWPHAAREQAARNALRGEEPSDA